MACADDPVLLTEWLLPVVGLELRPGAAFRLETQPSPGGTASRAAGSHGRKLVDLLAKIT